MTARESLPYGTWPSSVSAQAVAGKSLRFGTLQADNGTVFWSESRPDEGGRGVIVRATETDEPEDILPSPWSARSKVHEYGGGEFLASCGRVFFVEAESQDIYELVSGHEPRRLTNEPELRFADMALDTARDRLIAVAEHHEAGSHNPENLLLAIDAGPQAKGVLSRIASGHDFFAAPRVSPDGGMIAWTAWDLPHMPWEHSALYVAEFDEEGALGLHRHIAGGPGSAVFQPEWLPDGRLGFVWDKSGWGRLYVWEGGDPRPLTTNESDLLRPQWVFRMQSWMPVDSARAAAAFIDEGETKLGQVDLANGAVKPLKCNLRAIDALAPLGDGLALIGASDVAATGVIWLGAGGKTSELRNAGQSDLDASDVSKGKMLRFDGSGGPLYALHYAPANTRFVGPDNELPPTIVLVHGGPTGMADRGLKLKTQYWTSRGFAVCDLDYSGSAGYGRAYRERLQGQWGIRDVADVNALTRYLVEYGLADAKRFLISGSSAGGYTVLMALAMLDVFKAGGCSYGVSDLSQLQKITHKFEAGYLYGLTGTSEDECERVFAERSPLHHAESITCPVIFFQGLDDKVVPPEQSRSMAASLRERGVPVAYKEFTGEGHGFRRAETIIDVLESEYAFYSRILGLTPKQDLPDIEIENWSEDSD